jgi:hypothetical protein
MPATGHFPPPSRPDARYEAVVARGAKLQRRDRMTKAVVTGGVAVLLVLVVAAGVFAVSGGSSDDESPVASSTTEATTTTVAAPKDEVTVTATADQGTIRITVKDPKVALSQTPNVCAYVRLQPSGPAQVAAAEGTSCFTPTAGDPTAITVGQLIPTEGAEVACGINASNSIERDDPAPTTTVAPTDVAVDHEFDFEVPPGLAPGDYVAEVVAGLDSGDSCPSISASSDQVRPASVAVEIR